MNKLLSIALLGTALSLTACGGDSDSSGSSNLNEVIPAKFLGLPNCEIGNNALIPQDFFFINVSTNGAPTCLVKVPDLNNGRTFSLSCIEIERNGEDFIQIINDVIEDGRSNKQSIDEDVQKFVRYVNDDNATTSDSKYGYSCNIA